MTIFVITPFILMKKVFIWFKMDIFVCEYTRTSVWYSTFKRNPFNATIITTTRTTTTITTN